MKHVASPNEAPHHVVQSLTTSIRARRAFESLALRAAPSRLPALPAAPDDLRVQLTMPVWTINRSTDRDYVYERFARLGERYPLQFSAANALDYLAAWNARYLADRASKLVGVTIEHGLWTPRIRRRAQADVVFSYGHYPDGHDDVPVVWEHTFAPQLTSDEDAWQEGWRARASTIVERATRIVTATEVSVDWFVRMFPRATAKVRCVPYYLPDVTAISDDALQAKRADTGPVRVLFVGKEARRKGLPQFVAAYRALDAATQRQLDVHVISAMLDGAVDLPPAWHWQRSVPDVQAAMRNAHALIFPSLAEAFGLVLVEAMAAGCMPVTTIAPLQRSIVGEQAGLFADPRDAGAIADCLRTLVLDRDRLQHGMRAARERFDRQYAVGPVGQRYAGLLWEGAGRTGSVPVRNSPGILR
jgi:glycosyltransferase involved in cell wall biosynthesis